MSRLSKIAKYCGLALITLLLLELLVRIFLWIALTAYFNSKIPEPYCDRVKEINLPQIFEPWCHFDPVCYFIPKKGFFRGAKGRFNLTDQKKTFNEIRILCLGDSTTYGLGVEYGDSWPALLEKKLGKQFKTTSIRVLNAGLPGASSRQIKRIFQIYLKEIRADIVIWRNGVSLTDHYEINENVSYARAFLWSLIYGSRIVRIASIVLDPEGKGNMSLLEDLHDFITARVGEHLDRNLGSDFEMVRKIALENGSSYVAALDYLELEENKLNSDLDNYKSINIEPVIYTLPAFQAKTKEVSMSSIFIDDVHMTEIGTDLISEEIFHFLIESNWIQDLLQKK